MNRTVGVDTSYIGTLDFDQEEEDIQYMIKVIIIRGRPLKGKGGVYWFFLNFLNNFMSVTLMGKYFLLIVWVEKKPESTWSLKKASFFRKNSVSKINSTASRRKK